MRTVQKEIFGYATTNHAAAGSWTSPGYGYDWSRSSLSWKDTCGVLSTGLSANSFLTDIIGTFKSSLDDNYNDAYGSRGTEYTNFSCVPDDSELLAISIFRSAIVQSGLYDEFRVYKSDGSTRTNVTVNDATGSSVYLLFVDNGSSSRETVTKTFSKNGNAFKHNVVSGGVCSIGSWSLSEIKNGLLTLDLIQARPKSGIVTSLYSLYNIGISITVNIKQYDIVATGNNGTVTGSGTYWSGKNVSLTATPNSGYRFVEWSDGNKDATRTVVADADKSFTAIFEPGGLDKIFLGSDPVNSIYIGSTPVREVYVGSNKIYG